MDDEKDARLLAIVLHNELCRDIACKGVNDYIEAARNLLPKIREHLS